MAWQYHIANPDACPTCSALDSHEFQDGAEPTLPLHDHCRCYYTLVPVPPPTEPPPPGTTEETAIFDNFDTYGGDEIAQGGSTALYWLSLIDADSGETYSSYGGGTAAASTDNDVDGTYSAHLQKWCYVIRTCSPTVDMSEDGRFTTSDYLTLAVYLPSAADNWARAQVQFIDSSLIHYSFVNLTLQVGWNYLKTNISNLTGTADWTDIAQIVIMFDESDDLDDEDIYADDLRISKADPDDASTYNDTGSAWDFSGGEWHIYDDAPDAPFSLGQIDTASADRFAAIRQGDYSAINNFSGGLYLRAAGLCGLLAFAIDHENCYELKIDSDANTVTVLRWTNGNPYTLASIPQTIDAFTGYLVGLQREGGTLRVYLKAASNTTESVFSAVNLITSVVDSTYTAGRVGFVSYGASARFFTVRAGGLTSSLSLEHADTTVATGHLHASGSAYTTPAGSASRATFNTETVTLTELAHAVKALIDDLQADHLIT